MMVPYTNLMVQLYDGFTPQKIVTLRETQLREHVDPPTRAEVQIDGLWLGLAQGGARGQQLRRMGTGIPRGRRFAQG